MQKDYYLNILYPNQDKFLKLLDSLETDFYLTGGTALSRVYLNHRYSDDLDFFVNDNPKFQAQIDIVISELKKQNFNFDIVTKDKSFFRIFINVDNTILKTDFVNDIKYRTGDLESDVIFSKIDSKMNILSNKLSALTRFETKDVVDIVYLSNNFAFHWQEAFIHAEQKDLWVNPIEVSKVLDSFPLSKLDEISWINKRPEDDWFVDCISTITKDILLGADNSLYSND